jgi:hypothetical protein
MTVDHSIDRTNSLFDEDAAVLQRALSKYHNAWLYPTVKNYREDTAAKVVEAATTLVERHAASITALSRGGGAHGR